MKLWLSKTSEIPLPEQLKTQLILGIVSSDLAPGERLPSTSQLARRFHIHANTVRTAYRDLASRGWIECRRGSGFFVQASGGADRSSDKSLDLDRLISGLFEVARDHGHSLSEVHSRILRWLARQPPDHVLVIEPDADLCEILIAEIQERMPIRVVGANLDDCSNPEKLSGALCVALFHRGQDVRSRLPPEVPCLLLQSQSVPKALMGQTMPSPDTPIIVVSRCPSFLEQARTILVSVGIDPLALSLQDTSRKGWQRGLSENSFIISDSLSSRQLPRGCQPRVFRIIADDSMAEIGNRLA
jgi:GntR family transcriptional regulator